MCQKNFPIRFHDLRTVPQAQWSFPMIGRRSQNSEENGPFDYINLYNRCFSKNIGEMFSNANLVGFWFNSEKIEPFTHKKRLVDREVSKIINNPSNFLSWYDTSFSLWVLTFCPSPKNRITIHHVLHSKKWDHEKFWHYSCCFSIDKLKIRF